MAIRYLVPFTSLLGLMSAYTIPDAAAKASSCEKAICGMESSWGRGGYFGRRLNVDNVQQCLDFCNLPRRWGECKSFTLSDTGYCWIHDQPARDGSTEDPGSNSYVWDKECEACGNVPTPTTTAPPSSPTTTCLPKGSVCEVEAKARGGDGLGYYGSAQGVDYPYACWEVCSDARRPPRCKSFTWEPSTQQCLFYDQAANVTHEAEDGSGVWLWDTACWSCGLSGYT